MVNKMVKTANNIFWKVKSRDKVSPARLFAYTDRDGVANVFDCRPFNKRKQDDLGKWNDGTPITEEDQVIGELNDKQIKPYREFRKEGLKHKTALELAKTLK